MKVSVYHYCTRLSAAYDAETDRVLSGGFNPDLNQGGGLAHTGGGFADVVTVNLGELDTQIKLTGLT